MSFKVFIPTKREDGRIVKTRVRLDVIDEDEVRSRARFRYRHEDGRIIEGYVFLETPTEAKRHWTFFFPPDFPMREKAKGSPASTIVFDEVTKMYRETIPVDPGTPGREMFWLFGR